MWNKISVKLLLLTFWTLVKLITVNCKCSNVLFFYPHIIKLCTAYANSPGWDDILLHLLSVVSDINMTDILSVPHKLITKVVSQF